MINVREKRPHCGWCGRVMLSCRELMPLAALAPDGFPLRPLAGLRRGALAALHSRRQDWREPVREQGTQLGCGEEVDEQALFGPGEVADGEPTVKIVLGHLELGPDIGPCSVDP